MTDTASHKKVPGSYLRLDESSTTFASGVKMNQAKTEKILDKLDEIENEMKRIHYWLSSESTGVGSFEHWLQFTFLPNARNAVQTNSIPQQSQVGVMALRQYDYHSVTEEAHPLIQILCDFDDAIEEYHRGTEL
jgi:uncharacterized protein YqcC (DUF446 family)